MAARVSDLELEAAVAFLRMRAALYWPLPPLDLPNLVQKYAGVGKKVVDIPEDKRLEFLADLNAIHSSR
jgi:hypothetical protein